MWRVPREWDGRTAFVIGGGESVRDVDLDRLRGQPTVVINSSYAAAPWADYLVFTDKRWWRQHRATVRSTFRGRIVTITPSYPDADLLVLNRQRSSGVSTDPTRLVCWHTTLTTTLNLVALLGAARAGVLGLDGRGGWHHAPHPVEWGRNANRHAMHGEALAAQTRPLADMGLAVFNLNPNSAHRMFQFAVLDEMLEEALT